ncbi:ESPR domain-containing protein [Pasteurellaceae bacterium 22721_9_1]
MNNIFKVIWNHATQSWVAVSELSRAKGKTKSKVTAVATVVSLGLLSGEAIAAAIDTNPNGDSVLTTDRSTILIGKGFTSVNAIPQVAPKPPIEKGYKNTVIGENAVVVGNETVVIGTDAQGGAKEGNNSSKMPRNADQSVVIGNKASTSINSNQYLKDIVVIGYNASSAGGANTFRTGSVAIGANAQAEGTSGQIFRDNPYQPFSVANGVASGSYAHSVIGDIGLVKSSSGSFLVDADGNGSYINNATTTDTTAGTAVGYNAYAAGGGAALGSLAVAKTSATAIGSFAIAGDIVYSNWSGHLCER